MPSKAHLLMGLFLAAYCSVAFSAAAQTLRIYHIDVDQADATLFVSPSGNTLLVDSGKNGHGPRIKAVMQRAGVTRIDHFVATHYHEDHYGGIDDLAKDGEISIGRTYDRGDKDFLPSKKTLQDTYKDYDDTVGANAEHLTRGETIPLDPLVSVTCVSSGGVVLGEDPPVPGHDENDMSISLLIEYGNFRYFIGGDIEVATETKIAERDHVTDVDVYQANHHGSHTSSSLPFMLDMNPRVIVISNGNNGRYKHPRKITLKTYEELLPAPSVFQTNKYLKGGLGGNVSDEFIGDLEASDADGTILISVDLAADEYVVSYRTESHTFPIRDRGVADRGGVIDSLLPNPVGLDRLLEEATSRNDGGALVSMASWTLREPSGRLWTVTSIGTIGAGQSESIQRHGTPTSLNNGGHVIPLFDQNNRLQDHFAYSGSQKGAAIATGH